MVKFDLEKLRGKKVAVNCVTEEQAQDFVNWVCIFEVNTDYNHKWEDFKEESCYRLQESLAWIYAGKLLYKELGFEIISYEEALLKENKSKESSKSKKIKNLHKVLRKKDEKIKNQRKEITLLLKQKKELKTKAVVNYVENKIFNFNIKDKK